MFRLETILLVSNREGKREQKILQNGLLGT